MLKNSQDPGSPPPPPLPRSPSSAAAASAATASAASSSSRCDISNVIWPCFQARTRCRCGAVGRNRPTADSGDGRGGSGRKATWGSLLDAKARREGTLSVEGVDRRGLGFRALRSWCHLLNAIASLMLRSHERNCYCDILAIMAVGVLSMRGNAILCWRATNLRWL